MLAMQLFTPGETSPMGQTEQWVVVGEDGCGWRREESRIWNDFWCESVCVCVTVRVSH